MKRFPETALEAGHWSFDWDGTTEAGRAAGAGVYFYRVRLDGKESAGGRLVLAC